MTAIEETFGPYGGRYVPETLIPALDELAEAWEAAKRDPAFRAELDELGARTSGGRHRSPAPTASPRASVYLKREDLNHTGAHKINNALGQVVLANRLGKRRIIAETGAGQHGVATATACARFGLECVVYMGAEDMRRQAPNVERMRLLGATVEPVEYGTRTLKEATSAAIRDWITNVATTHYVIGSCVGPAPYPELVAELQAVIGLEARAQLLEAEGALPDVVVACVGGGSNAIGMFAAFLDDAEVRLVGVEAAGAASLGTGRAAVLHGARSSVLADEDGQIADAHSISAGLDYPGVGPEHAWLRDTGRARVRRPAPTRGARRLRAPDAHSRGSSPRSSRPTPSRSSTGWTPSTSPSASRVAATRTWRRRWPRSRAAHEEDARRLPRLRAGDAGARTRPGRGGCGYDRARLPVLRPAGRRPGDPARSERALARGMRTAKCLDCLAETRALVGETRSSR